MVAQPRADADTGRLSKRLDRSISALDLRRAGYALIDTARIVDREAKPE